MIPGFAGVYVVVSALLPNLRRAFDSPRPLFYRLSSISMIKPEGYQLLVCLSLFRSLLHAPRNLNSRKKKPRERQRRVNKK